MGGSGAPSGGELQSLRAAALVAVWKLRTAGTAVGGEVGNRPMSEARCVCVVDSTALAPRHQAHELPAGRRQDE
jgi:hypothetical protein